MVGAIIIILIILWALGYTPLSGTYVPNPELFVINGHPVTLFNILILLIIGWAIGVLPPPFQAIASVLLILWVLSVLGILAIAGLPNIIILAVIVALVISIFV
jgi:hypothetical protein